jgi:dTDP-4-dehydrorhamnose reductase
LARHVFSAAAGLGTPSPTIEAIMTADYPTAARRPANSRLSTKKLQENYGIVPRPWREAIDDIVVALLTDSADRGQA